MNLIVNANLRDTTLAANSSLIVNLNIKSATLEAILSKQLNSNLFSAQSISLSQKIINLLPLSVLLIASSNLNISPYLKNYKAIYFGLFGESFSQNTNTVTILKSQLLGLNPSVNNTAESLLAALLNRWIYFTQHDGNGKIQITYWGSYRANGKEVNVIELFFFNQLDKTNIYEIETLNNIINLQDY